MTKTKNLTLESVSRTRGGVAVRTDIKAGAIADDAVKTDPYESGELKEWRPFGKVKPIPASL